MKHLIIFCGLVLFLAPKLSFSQGAKLSVSNKLEFDRLDSMIRHYCGEREGYIGVKMNRKEIKRDLQLVRLIDDLSNKKITLLELDSILKLSGLKPYFETHKTDQYNEQMLTFHGSYIRFNAFWAIANKDGKIYSGAVLDSEYTLYCKGIPDVSITEVPIDVKFFKTKVVRQLTCNYEVNTRLRVGDAITLGALFFHL
jgi:hypothetical protein